MEDLRRKFPILEDYRGILRSLSDKTLGIRSGSSIAILAVLLEEYPMKYLRESALKFLVELQCKFLRDINSSRTAPESSPNLLGSP